MKAVAPDPSALEAKIRAGSVSLSAGTNRVAVIRSTTLFLIELIGEKDLVRLAGLR
jgi:hypothetical protein